MTDEITNYSLEHIIKELKTPLTLYTPKQRDHRASSRIDLYSPETPLRTDSKCVVDVIRQHTCALAASAQSLAVSSQKSKECSLRLVAKDRVGLGGNESYPVGQKDLAKVVVVNKEKDEKECSKKDSPGGGEVFSRLVAIYQGQNFQRSNTPGVTSHAYHWRHLEIASERSLTESSRSNA
jgi:hypothetical protein